MCDYLNEHGTCKGCHGCDEPDSCDICGKNCGNGYDYHACECGNTACLACTDVCEECGKTWCKNYLTDGICDECREKENLLTKPVDVAQERKDKNGSERTESGSESDSE